MRRAGWILVLATVGAGCNEDMLNPMADSQPRVGAYTAYSFYADGLAMRTPPAGTVPRDRIVNRPDLTRGMMAGPTGDVHLTTFPMPVNAVLLQRGRRRFDIICATCHGPVGDGDSIVARQMSLRQPPSLHLYRDRPIGYLFDVITNGFGMMASYAAELPIEERWAVVAYIRALQLSQAAPLALAPPAAMDRLAKEPRP